MDLWERFWSKKRDISTIYKLGKFIPAGPWDLYWRWKRYEGFLDGLDISNPRIIELGCGTGFMTFRMLERYGGKAVLVDTSEAALDIAREYSEQFDIDSGRVTYVNKD
jgi:ubiquinone/menaquinone biosynthesis C-methylase UbiE